MFLKQSELQLAEIFKFLKWQIWIPYCTSTKNLYFF